jgi:hypothetical protein
MINAHERVEIPKKITQTPSAKKRGRQKPLKRIMLRKSNQEKRILKLL